MFNNYISSSGSTLMIGDVEGNLHLWDASGMGRASGGGGNSEGKDQGRPPPISQLWVVEGAHQVASIRVRNGAHKNDFFSIFPGRSPSSFALRGRRLLRLLRPADQGVGHRVAERGRRRRGRRKEAAEAVLVLLLSGEGRPAGADAGAVLLAASLRPGLLRRASGIWDSPNIFGFET